MVLLLLRMSVLVHLLLLVVLSMEVRMTLLLLCVLGCVLLRLAYMLLLVLSMRVDVSVSRQRYVLLRVLVSRGSMMSSIMVRCIMLCLIMLQEHRAQRRRTAQQGSKKTGRSAQS